jgi:hypothetical protein
LAGTPAAVLLCWRRLSAASTARCSIQTPDKGVSGLRQAAGGRLQLQKSLANGPWAVVDQPRGSDALEPTPPTVCRSGCRFPNRKRVSIAPIPIVPGDDSVRKKLVTHRDLVPLLVGVDVHHVGP